MVTILLSADKQPLCDQLIVDNCKRHDPAWFLLEFLLWFCFTLPNPKGSLWLHMYFCLSYGEVWCLTWNKPRVVQCWKCRWMQQCLAVLPCARYSRRQLDFPQLAFSWQRIRWHYKHRERCSTGFWGPAVAQLRGPAVPRWTSKGRARMSLLQTSVNVERTCSRLWIKVSRISDGLAEMLWRKQDEM